MGFFPIIFAVTGIWGVFLCMKEIIARTEIPALRESCPGYRVNVVSGHEIRGNPDAVVVLHPTFGDMLDEERAIADSGSKATLVAIVEPFRRLLFEAVFPSAVILDDSERIGKEDLRCREEKKIRFTEKEKRTLKELPYGLCSKELAARLGVSERSVRRMKERLMRKTGLVSSEQLMIYALVAVEISTRSSSHSADTG